jgi:hypothetical protein
MSRRAGRARRLWRRLVRFPRAGKLAVAAGGLALATIAWQVAHKPSELVTAIVPAAPKPPARTWEAYGDAFEAHATALIRPELLAALAQAESAGDPLASPAWQLRLRANPLDLYGPASSAVGLLQMTDANLADARRLCVHGHEVAREGPWTDPEACWLNGLYSRLVPGHAIEMTAAWLDTSVREIAAAQRLRGLPQARVRRLAAVVHLCGRARAAEYARRGFWTVPGERCGEQDVARYVARVEALARQFEALRAPRGSSR